MDFNVSGGLDRGSVPMPAPGHPSRDVVTAGLQQLFASIADEPIPDDFLRLLDDIDASALRLDPAQTAPSPDAQRSAAETAPGDAGASSDGAQ